MSLCQGSATGCTLVRREQSDDDTARVASLLAKLPMDAEKVVSEEPAASKFGLGKTLRSVGPGLVLAAAAVGGGDLVTSVVAGQQAGMALLWALVIAVILKLVMSEAIGRSFIAGGRTLVQNWGAFGRPVLLVIFIYVILWALAYGAAGPSTVGLAANAMFPIFSVKTWAIVHSIVACGLVLAGRYSSFEKIMKAFVALTFVTMVGTAALLTPSPVDIAGGLLPTIPDGQLVYAIAMIGGIGGTLTLVSYGYWVRDKGWRNPQWVPVMRVDVVIGYIMTCIFAASALIVGAQVLAASKKTISGSEGLVPLSDIIENKHGAVVSWLFLIGFWAVTYTAVIGTWNGIGYIFAEIVGVLKHGLKDDTDRYLSERSIPFRIFVLLITFGGIPFIIIGQPVPLLIAWGILGALFLPFLAVTLLWLSNTRGVGVKYRNRKLGLSNICLFLGLVVFVFLGWQTISSYF